MPTELTLRDVHEMAERARRIYARTKQWTINPDQSCETIRVPVALLNRIRDLAEAEATPEAVKP